MIREVHNHTIDSTRWNDFRFREGDIVVVTWAKSGTTWIQQILAEMILPGTDAAILDISPWIDHRCFPREAMFRMLEAQTHRRFVKSHLPVDALSLSPLARYIYVARDGRDALWSWYNHHRHLTQRALHYLNSAPGRVGPPLEPATADIRQYFHDFLDRDGFPLWPFWSHVQSWWDIRNRGNVLLVHFNHLKADPRGEIARIAAFLGMDIRPECWPRLLERSSFEYMKAHASRLSPLLNITFAGGAGSFVFKGNNGRWREVLTDSDVRKYESLALRNLSADCARWLATGER